ncbi:MAG: hypothetical protein HY420_02545 [Candidatus Kerfeldbacteria bacterium]|nr:hypothetical protein [Candidatus Kerfeldbacteria bacterium]
MHTHEGASGRKPPSIRERKQWQSSYLKVRRLLLATRIFYCRFWHEQEVILRGNEPRFRVSYDRLREIADNPWVLLRGFGRFMRRLRRFARSETDEAVRAYHAVSQPRSQSQPTTTNEPPREET